MFRDEHVTLLKQVALNLATNVHPDKRGPKRNELERQKKSELASSEAPIALQEVCS